MAKPKIINGPELDMLTAGGQAPFRYCPDDIGKIVYISSSDYRAAPYTKEQKAARLAIYAGLSAVVVIAAFIWQGYASWLPWLALVAGAIAVFISWHNVNTFEGVDYFLGEAGFGSAAFKDTRDNVSPRRTIYFSQIAEVTHREEDIYVRERDGDGRVSERHYDHTNFTYEFYGLPDVQGNVELVHKKSGKYVKKQGQESHIEYYFYRAVEEVWSRYRHDRIEATNPSQRIFSEVRRSTVGDGYVLVPRVALTNDAIIVDSTVFPHDQIKSIKLDDGQIVIKHANYTSSMLGLKHTGDKAVIDLSRIGNAEMLCYYLRIQ